MQAARSSIALLYGIPLFLDSHGCLPPLPRPLTDVGRLFAPHGRPQSAANDSQGRHCAASEPADVFHSVAELSRTRGGIRRAPAGFGTTGTFGFVDDAVNSEPVKTQAGWRMYMEGLHSSLPLEDRLRRRLRLRRRR